MDVTKIPPGRTPPDEINVLVEIPQGGVPVKYELDKASGALFVNRFLHTAMYYPANYGFIPNTLSEDGDPCDVLALSQVPVAPGAVIRCRPVGALLMEDENGIDEKILAVPVDELNPYFDGIENYSDLPKIMLDQIDHFFRHYKDLEKGKWVQVRPQLADVRRSCGPRLSRTELTIAPSRPWFAPAVPTARCHTGSTPGSCCRSDRTASPSLAR
jgi:inorganic pyrophosphatase